MTRPAGQIAISKLGTFTSMEGRRVSFTPEIFSDLVASYDPELRPAPLVIGHPKLDDPAYGWVKKLSTEGVLLHAEPHQVDPEFAELVNAGRYPSVSMAMYLPNAPGNPKPGHHYPKHIGFLGGVGPAVTGLGAAKLDATHFAEGDGTEGVVAFAFPLSHMSGMVADMFQRIRDYFVERDGLEKADALIPQWQIRSIAEAGNEPSTSHLAFAAAGGTATETEDMNTQTAQFAERETALTTRETALQARERVIAEREAADRRALVVSFAGTLVQAGKLLPAEQASVVEVLVAVEGAQALTFAEAGAQVTKTPSQILRSFLEGLPVRIRFGERSAAELTPSVVQFAGPPGLQVDPVRAELHGRVRAYQQEHPGTSFENALAACSR